MGKWVFAVNRIYMQFKFTTHTKIYNAKMHLTDVVYCANNFAIAYIRNIYVNNRVVKRNKHFYFQSSVERVSSIY